jgi:glycosyltransferase involved in cell wall biosynthesis
VTRGGVNIGEDAQDQKKEPQCWIQKNTQPHQQFHAKKEKENFMEVKKEFLKEKEPSTSNTAPKYDTPIFYMPQSLDHTYKGEKTKKVSNLKNFLESFFKLLNDKNAMDFFKSMLEKYSIEEGIGIETKKINQVHRKKRTSREFRLNANIRDFNMGNAILDLGSDVNIFPKKT